MTKYHSNRTDCYFWLGASAEAETGSRPSGQAATRLVATRFDPARGCFHYYKRVPVKFGPHYHKCVHCGETR